MTRNRLLLICVLCAVTVILVTAVIFALAAGGNMLGKGDKTVGKQIKAEDITEFYYTEDSSTDPPFFQRYVVRVQDGKHLFYHEKREGDHWPLYEEDITVSGTLEMSDEQWDRFFGLIEGSTVKNREEVIEDGGSGPWLFLYWNGDKGKFQEFTFQSYGKLLEYEAFCEELKQQQLGE